MRSVQMSAKRLRTGDGAVTGTGADYVDASSQAWRVLDTTGRWIAHADAKAAVILAAAGVIGGALFNMLRGSGYGSWADAFAIACFAFLAATVASAGIALRPRRDPDAEPASLIYFDHVARQTQYTEVTYVQALTELLQNADALTKQIGRQVWSVSRVASVKYRWVDRALVSLLAAFLSLALTALAVAAH